MSVNRSYPSDPILAHRPGFAKSLPVQILLLGITLTLTTVLIIHLVFTAQYHWPLAPVNCILQMSAVTTLLVSCIATLHVVLSSTVDQSMTWPYMLDYIAVEIPPLDDQDNTEWAMGELAAWLLMNATTSGLIQITHIQFLTLLFPSGLERRLIYILLGPLAIVASIMHVLRMHDDAQVAKVATAVQNICNATLSLLFTAALFLWGCVVNRRAAWRTDGGTAAFGAGALVLAIVSTALTFLYIPRRDQYAWMPSLVWSVVLWQSFVGWWWWVGAGMGVGELEELLRREEKRQEKRRAKITRRKVRKERAQTFWKDVTHVFCNGSSRQGGEPPRPPRAEGEGEGSSSSESTVSGGEGERQIQRRSSEETVVVDDGARSVASQQTDESTRSGGSGYLARFLNHYRAGRYVYGLYLGLRHAHLTAAREQAVERVERINQAYGPDAEAGGRPVFGWGLGSFGIRRHERRRTEQPRVEVEMDEFESEDEDGRKPWQHEDAPPMEAGRGEGGEGEIEGRARRRVTRRATSDRRTARGLDEHSHQPSSMWWWGPLRRWRLQDSTDYRS
ncbi:hypothetical protein LXA43DRAFT_973212 [Ganoderma leucocontextum]|nr:hypothetical protein LXA43DRAFT_973212 [Ganoderma leucocontextum]